MRTSIRFAAVTAALAASVAFSGAANAAATATASANAEIMSTIAVAKNQDMDFGKIAVNGAGVLTISADESSPAACPATLICNGARVPAKFTISGTAGAATTAVVRQTSVNLTGPASATMALNAFTVFFPGGNTLALPTPTSTLGEADFNVGGALNVAAAQAAGAYVGSFNVDVEYQ